MGTPKKGTLNDEKFPAIHNDDIKVTLLMRKVTLNASVYVRLQKERQMLKKIVRYPVVRSEIRTFSFDGRTHPPNVFMGRFPDRVMVGLLQSDAFNGDLKRYPHAFEFEWRRISLQNPKTDRGSMSLWADFPIE